MSTPALFIIAKSIIHNSQKPETVQILWLVVIRETAVCYTIMRPVKKTCLCSHVAHRFEEREKSKVSNNYLKLSSLFMSAS